jgi:hypothetical protein
MINCDLNGEIMFKPRDKQTTFFDATYFCEKLIPQDSFYRKFRGFVWPNI